MIFRNHTANVAPLKEWTSPKTLDITSFISSYERPKYGRPARVFGINSKRSKCQTIAIWICVSRVSIILDRLNVLLVSLILWQIYSQTDLSGSTPSVCQDCIFFRSSIFPRKITDLFGKMPAGNHLEEKAGPHVSFTCPFIWAVSVALTCSAWCRWIFSDNDRVGEGRLYNHTSTSKPFVSPQWEGDVSVRGEGVVVEFWGSDGEKHD